MDPLVEGDRGVDLHVDENTIGTVLLKSGGGIVPLPPPSHTYMF